MKTYHPFTIAGLLSFFVPLAAFAQTNIFDLENMVMFLFERLYVLLWLIAILVFFWGLVKFIMNASDTADHEEGKQLIIWGLISFLVVLSVWAIVSLLVDTFGIQSGDVRYVDKNGTFL